MEQYSKQNNKKTQHNGKNCEAFALYPYLAAQNYCYNDFMLHVTGFLNLPLIKDFKSEAFLKNELLH